MLVKPTFLDKNKETIKADIASFVETTKDMTVVEKRQLMVDMNTDGKSVTYVNRFGQIVTQTDLSEKIKDYASWRIVPVDNIIKTSDNVGLNIFEVQNLTGDELPIIVNQNPSGSPAKYYVAGDGGATYYKGPAEYGVETTIEPYFLVSETKSYRISDAIRGRAPQKVIDDINEDLASSLNIEIDKICWQMIDNVIGVFPSTTLYVYDKRITNYPTTNYINIPAEGGLTPNVFKKIFQYGLLLGSKNGRKVNIKNIYLSVEALTSFWDWLDIVSGYAGGDFVNATGTVPSDIRSQIWRSGTITNMFGYTVNIITVNWLPTDVAYFDTTESAGFFWTKTELDKVLTKDKEFDFNKIDTKLTKWVAHCLPDTHRPFVGKVKYK